MSEPVLHPIRVKLRPHPSIDRFRVSLAALIFGEFSFTGQITSIVLPKRAVGLQEGDDVDSHEQDPPPDRNPRSD